VETIILPKNYNNTVLSICIFMFLLEGRRNNPIPKGKRKGLFFEYTNESVTTIERVTVTVDSE
jgi:hypothetical protein